MARGKLSKPTRGGGKKFSRDVRPADDAPGMWDTGPREPAEEEEDEDSEEEESSEEESGDETAKKPAAPVDTSEMTRAERKAAQKAAKEAKKAKAVGGNALDFSDESEEEAPGPSKAKPAAQGFQVANPNASALPEGAMTRREREAVEAAAAKERYRKLHEAGKTEEAKSDLARLALIRAEREEKAKQRQAELDEKKRQAEIKATLSGKKKR